jgi:hypothetical protein
MLRSAPQCIAKLPSAPQCASRRRSLHHREETHAGISSAASYRTQRIARCRRENRQSIPATEMFTSASQSQHVSAGANICLQ